MSYDPQLVQPMREELTRLDVKELLTADDVDQFMASKSGTAMIIVNSVCGCAAGGCRPAIAMALKHEKSPDRAGTVFAGQDVEATEKARSFFGDIPPSSPAIALFKDGEMVHFFPRHQIEGKDPQTIAWELMAAFDTHCAAPTS